MEKKIVFIDIDGTLVDRHEQIPASAQEAIHKAKEKGHLLYLCTGRSKPEIYDHLLAVGFDGVIGAGGGFIESQGEIIFHRQVADNSVRHMVDYFVEKGFSFYLESNGGLYGNVQLEQHLTDLVTQGMTEAEKAKQGKHPFLEKITFSDEQLYRNDVNKACFLENPAVPFSEIQQEFAGEFDVIHCTVPIFGDDSGELMVPGIHKGIAIEFLLTHLDMPLASTLGIGDGMNDKEMLELCQVGIAMGNAKAGLKEIADFITTDLEADGLYNAFKKYDLI